MIPYGPQEPTTPEGWKVLAWTTVLIFLAIAGLVFYFSLRAAAPDVASQLRTIGFVCIGIAAVILIGKRLVTIFLDS
jgi:hypothetical protein